MKKRTVQRIALKVDRGNKQTVGKNHTKIHFLYQITMIADIWPVINKKSQILLAKLEFHLR